MAVSKPPPASEYDAGFYAHQQASSYRSALKILGVLFEIYRPQRLIDVGCGTGGWLKAASELGVIDFMGVEGNWVQRDMAVIPFDRIRQHDLEKPLRLDEKFDLAMTLEVGEHLPASCAAEFVTSLTRLAPVVLFSAAAPRQGGTHHVNEQWPAYWTKLFGERGFTIIDAIRRKIWDEPDVQWWYAQNAMLFVERDFLSRHAALRDLKKNSLTPGDETPMALIHPGRLSQEPSAKDLAKQFPGAVRRAVQRRFKKSP